MFKSSRKKLIAIGCSYTEHYLVSSQSPHIDHDFIRWPQYLAEMLDMGFVNLGRSGAGNDQILAKTLDAVIKEKNEFNFFSFQYFLFFLLRRQSFFE